MLNVTSLTAVATLALILGVAVPSAAQSQDPSEQQNLFVDTQSDQWKAMIFGGRLSEHEIAGIINPTKPPSYTRANFVGLALSREVYRWKGFSIDLEGGIGYQFAPSSDNNSTGHVWGAAYLRYNDFPWNHIVHTSVAGSVGLNYVNRITRFETDETTSGQPQKLLHYFSPEIAFSLPERRDLELVLRIHHRSSAKGVFGCGGCGSNIPTIGLRKAF